jgi:hypothetical protein
MGDSPGLRAKGSRNGAQGASIFEESCAEIQNGKKGLRLLPQCGRFLAADARIALMADEQ